MYHEIARKLRAAYDRQVEERETSDTQPWKVDVRQRFLELLRAEGKHRLIEIGAGTGVHGLFFQESGIEVVTTDLSQAMVESCRAKGLDARELDFLSLDFGEKFDAVFAMNCLLHVAPGDLRQVLAAIRQLLNPDGLFFWGQYGESSFRGCWIPTTISRNGFSPCSRMQIC